MLLFRSEEHASRWCRRWRMEHGGLLTLDQTVALARAWYEQDRRSPEWRRPTLDQAEAIFRGLGLAGPFWSLR